MSSWNANRCSPSSKFSWIASSALCWPRGNRSGIRASPCSPPSPWWMVWMSHRPPRDTRSPVKHQHERQRLPCTCDVREVRSNIAAREIWSNAPIPSMESTVHVVSISHKPCKDRSQHALTTHTGAGLCAASTVFPNCWAIVRAISRRTTSPATMPRTPPSGFREAVNRVRRQLPPTPVLWKRVHRRWTNISARAARDSKSSPGRLRLRRRPTAAVTCCTGTN